MQRSCRYVNHRNDLTYLIGEMIGELNNGHAYVAGGETTGVRRGSNSACSAPNSPAIRLARPIGLIEFSRARTGERIALSTDCDWPRT